MVLGLSVREIYDLLSLSSKFIEIGQEFGGVTEETSQSCSLLSHLSSELM